jgi:hypothetical protein
LQALALYTGQHLDGLDAMLYLCGAMATAATAGAMAAELVLPHAFWLGCVKVYTLWLQVGCGAGEGEYVHKCMRAQV